MTDDVQQAGHQHQPEQVYPPQPAGSLPPPEPVEGFRPQIVLLIAAGIAAVTFIGMGGWWFTGSTAAPRPRTVAEIQAETEAKKAPMLSPRSSFTVPGRGFLEIAVQPGGKLLAVPQSETQTVRLWDVTTGKATTTLRPESYGSSYAAAFSPDGTLVAGAGSGLRVWKATGGTPTRVFTTTDGLGPRASQVAFGPGGQQLVTTQWSSTEVTFWNVSTGRALGKVDVGSQVLDMEVTPDRRHVVVLTDKAAVVLDMGTAAWSGQPTGTRRITLPVALAGFGALAISPDGKTLATTSRAPGACVQLWDLADGSSTAVLADKANSAFSANLLAFSPNGKRLVTGSRPMLWDVSKRSVVNRLGEDFNTTAVVFGPDDKTVVTVSSDFSNSTFRVDRWDLP